MSNRNGEKTVDSIIREFPMVGEGKIPTTRWSGIREAMRLLEMTGDSAAMIRLAQAYATWYTRVTLPQFDSDVEAYIQFLKKVNLPNTANGNLYYLALTTDYKDRQSTFLAKVKRLLITGPVIKLKRKDLYRHGKITDFYVNAVRELWDPSKLRIKKRQ